MTEPAGKSEQPLSALSPAQASTATASISIEDFKRLQLRVGTIVSAEDHPNATRLLILKVDIGDAAPRQVVAGIKGAYQASELVGKLVVVVANLKPAMLRGVESQGMVLAASDSASMALVSPERLIPPGSVVK